MFTGAPPTNEGSDGGGTNPSQFQTFLNTLKKDFNIEVPVLDNVRGTVIDVLLGKSIDLIRWNPKPFEIRKDFRPPEIPLGVYFGIIVSLRYGASFRLFGDFEAGIALADPDRDGSKSIEFYLGDNYPGAQNGSGDDGFEAGLSYEAFIGLSASALGILTLYGEGGIRGTVGVDLADVRQDNAGNRSRVPRGGAGGDNRVYFDELGFLVQNYGLGCTLTVGGALDLFLRAGIEIDLFLFSFSVTLFEIGVNLATFDQACDLKSTPDIARVQGEQLVMRAVSAPAGQNIRVGAQRNPDSPSQVTALRISRGNDQDAGVQTWSVAEVRGVRTLIVEGTEGPDSIVIDPIVYSSPELAIESIVVNARGGDDTINLGTVPAASRLKNTTIYAGAGDDQVLGSSARDVIYGGAGQDRIYGREGDDQIYGEAGDDAIDGGTGKNLLDGGDGADALSVTGTGENRLIGGPGDDTIQGGGGNDTIEAGDGNDLISSGQGDDTVDGGVGSDTVEGGEGHDTIRGSAGNDILSGNEGRDQIDGGEGDDTIFGNDDADTLVGGWGNDQIFAGSSSQGGVAAGTEANTIYGDVINPSDVPPDDGNHDTIFGDQFANVIYGGPGRDRILGLGGDDSLEGNDGDDVLSGGGGHDTLQGGSGDDTVLGQEGDDGLVGNGGDDALDGGSGSDILWGGDAGTLSRSVLIAAYHPSLVGLLIDLTKPSQPGIDLDGHDTLQGGSETDWLFGGGDADTLKGGLGDDYLDAGLGNDLDVHGDDGNDLIRGGAGDDRLHGDLGIDQLQGDDGDDHLFGDAGVDGGSTALQTGQTLRGGPGNDTLYAYAPGNLATQAALVGDSLFGDAGQDTLYGNLRRETLDGGADEDQLDGDFLSGPNYLPSTRRHLDGAADTLMGGPGNDRVYGGGGDDRLFGGGDNDELEGQDGADRVYGGEGIDFLYLDVNPLYQTVGADILDGHFGNAQPNDRQDDLATDVLIVRGDEGPTSHDAITVGEDAQGRLVVNYTGRTQPILVTWRSSTNQPLVEQFRILGLEGDDTLSFTRGAGAVNVSALENRKNAQNQPIVDWIGWLDGGPGADTLMGSDSRDQIFGGDGRDTIHGYGGNDRLWGDDLELQGNGADDVYGGAGDDDLLGANGQNRLFAWSEYPGDVSAMPSGSFGIDTAGNRCTAPGCILEDTGFDRMLGGIEQDTLYAGTNLDFLHGGDDDIQDRIVRTNGTYHEPGDTSIRDDDWKQFIKGQDRVWYVQGTQQSEYIYVFHGLVNATGDRRHYVVLDRDGNLNSGNELRFNLDYARWNSLPNLADLPLALQLRNEDDYQLIVVDALGGDDTILVDDEVLKTIWIDGGADSDTVTVESYTSSTADGRRDVIIGGDGNDFLKGSSGSEWIFGGAGDDRIEGGNDAGSSDLIFGEAGADILQLVPQDVSAAVTTHDVFYGGDDFDRVVFWGADKDNNANSLPDHIAVRFDEVNRTYELASLVLDTQSRTFMVDGVGNFRVRKATFQAVDVEKWILDTRAGDDVVHADPAVWLDGQTWGIAQGDFQQGGTLGGLQIHGGDGTDTIFGGFLDDWIDGGDGMSADTIVGGGGDDYLAGGGSDDTIYGGDQHPFALNESRRRNGPGGTPFGAYVHPKDLAIPIASLPSVGLPLNQAHHPATLADASANLTHAHRIQGELTNEHLSQPQLVGDVNGDGVGDLLLTSDVNSYLLLGPVDFSQGDASMVLTSSRVDLSSIQNRADAILARDDGTFLSETRAGTPARRMGDLDGDGLNEVVFVDTVAFDLGPGRTLYSSQISAIKLDGLDATIPAGTTRRELSRRPSPNNPQQMLNGGRGDLGVGGGVAIHLLDWNGDGRAELLVTGSDGAHLYSSTSLLAGRPITDADRLTPASLGARLNAQVVGDVNGDGREDTLLTEAGSKSVQLLLGGETTVSPNRTLLYRTNLNLGRAYALGDIRHSIADIDQDGYDDFAVVLGDGNRGFIEIFRGGAQPDLNPDLVFDVNAPTNPRLTSGFDAGPAMYVQAGDWNGDSQTDLALGQTSSGSSELVMLWGMQGQATPHAPSDADVFLRGSLVGAGFGTLPAQPAEDLDGDGLVDLIVGASGADAVTFDRVANTNRTTAQAGNVFFSYGRREARSDGQAATDAATPVLSNSTLNGTGYLVAATDGQPYHRSATLPAPTAGNPPAEHWYRFRTLGDGQAGDQLRVTPAAQLRRTNDLRSATYGELRTLAGGGLRSSTQPDSVHVGGADRAVGIIEFDLSPLLRHRNRLQEIESARLTLDYEGATNSPGESLIVELLDDEADARVTPADASATGKELNRYEFQRALSTTGQIPALDLTATVRDFLEAGKTRLSIRFWTTSSVAALHVKAPGDEAKTRLAISTAVQGVGVDLYDATGAPLGQNQPVIDLRSLPAGEYLLRVANPAAAEQLQPLEYDIEIQAPVKGNAHPSYDRDVLEGGEGNDTLRGGSGMDRIWGSNPNGQEPDTFLTESIEARDFVVNMDLGINETPQLPAGDSLSSKPVVDLDPVVSVPDQPLRSVLANALHIPLTLRFDGGPQLARAIRQSDLLELTELDAGSRGIVSLAGLEYARNLENLALAHNFVSSVAPLGSARDTSGTAIGPARLQRLSLDGNRLSDLGPLSSLRDLRALSADYNAIDSLAFLSAMTPPAPSHLEFVSVDGHESELLDSAFGDSGKVLTDLGSFDEQINAIAVQPDGKIVVVGSKVRANGGRSDYMVARYKLDGELDETFGNGGVVITDFQRGTSSLATSVAILADGKIVVAGYANTNFHVDFALARYNPDGSLDRGFNQNGQLPGTLTLDLGGDDFAAGVAVQSNGKIVVVGSKTSNVGGNFASDFALARFKTDGSLDSSFNGGSFVTSFCDACWDTASSVAVQADDSIVVAGYTSAIGSYDFALVRYQRDGQLDPSFGTGGKLTTDIGGIDSFASGLAIQPDGKIVVAGSASDENGYDFAVARYHGNGTLDTTFSDDGKVTTPIGQFRFDYGGSVAIQADGSIVVAGNSYGPPLSFAMVRYRADGRLDTSFNRTGIYTTPPSRTWLLGGTVAYAPDGKIILAGTEAGDLAIWRINAGIRLDDLSPLAAASSLQVASFANNGIARVAPLEQMTSLQHLYLHNNQIDKIEGLVGTRLADDDQPGFSAAVGSERAEFDRTFYVESGSGWQANLSSVADSYAFHGDYRFHERAPSAVPTATATWTFEELVPGEYQVYATWPAHENRATNAPFTVVAGERQDIATLTQSVPILVNQRFAPDPRADANATLAGTQRPWQLLGTFAVLPTPGQDRGMLQVQLGNNADGIVAADAVRLLRVDQAPLAGLRTLTLAGNPLNNDAHQSFIPLLDDRIESPLTPFRDLTYSVDLHAPVIVPIDPIAGSGTMTVARLFATDADQPFEILLTGQVADNIVAHRSDVLTSRSAIPAGLGVTDATGIQVGPDGHIYVATFGSAKILRFDGATGYALPAPGVSGADFAFEPNGIYFEDLVFGIDGDLYAAGHTGNRILRFDHFTGEAKPATGESGADYRHLAAAPMNLAVGPTGNLYVTTDAGTIVRLGVDGQIPYLGEFIPSNGAYFVDVAFGPGRDLYVIERRPEKDMIVRIDSETGQLKQSLFEFAPTEQLNKLDFGPDGKLYVSVAGAAAKLLQIDVHSRQILTSIPLLPDSVSLDNFFTFTRPTTFTANSDYAAVQVNTHALSFNDQVVVLPNTVVNPTDLTVDFWFKTSHAGQLTFVSAAKDDANENHFTIGLQSNLFELDEFYRGRFYVELNDTNYYLGPAASVRDDQWHHVLVSRQSAPSELRLYLDGMLLGTALPTYSGPLSIASDGLVVGQEQDRVGGGYESVQAFYGQMDELQFWRGVRTPDEVLPRLRRLGTPAELASLGLTGYFTFDEGGGDVVRNWVDSTQVGRLGDVTGQTLNNGQSDIAGRPAFATDTPLVTTGPAVMTRVVGDLAIMSPINGFAGLARVRVTATDSNVNCPHACGRTAEQTVDLHVLDVDGAGLGSIYGSIFDDLNDNGHVDAGEAIEEWLVFLDRDGDGELDANEPLRLTDANGEYSFTELPLGEYRVRATTVTAGASSAWVAGNPVQAVSLTAASPIQQHVNFRNQRMVNAGPDRQLREGEETTFQAMLPHLTLTDITYAWQVVGVPADRYRILGNSNSSSFVIRPLDGGEPLTSASKYPVKVSVTGRVNQQQVTFTDTADLFVRNVTPELSVSGAPQASEGSTYRLNLTRVEPGFDTLQWWIDWGDGSPEQVVAGSASFVNHVFTDGPQTHTIVARAADEDGDYRAIDSVTVRVENVAPELPVGDVLSAQEGREFRLPLIVSDAGRDTLAAWQIDWGDGTVASNPNATHFYADGPAEYQVTITLTDEDGSYMFGRRVTVADVIPQVALDGVSEIHEGTAYRLRATALDVASDAVQTWLVNWGDGSDPDGDGQLGEFFPAAQFLDTTHVFSDGPLDASVTVTAYTADGTSAPTSQRVRVSNVQPTVVLGGQEFALEDLGYTLELSVVDPGDDVLESYRVDWGDGQVETYTKDQLAAVQRILAHVYTTAAPSVTIQLEVADQDGTYRFSKDLAVFARLLPSGDLDQNGQIDAGDIDLLSAAVRAQATDIRFDLNGDAAVDDGDRQTWIESIRGTYVGDANLDGQFNSSDLVAVFTVGHYEDGLDKNSRWSQGDWNGDEEFSSSDFVVAFQAGGYERGPRTPARQVGDANGDGLFNSSDVVMVFQAGEYEDAIDGNSTWSTGDWNGDGDFTTSDLVVAFQSGSYSAGATPTLGSQPRQIRESKETAWGPSANGHRALPVAVDALFDDLERRRRNRIEAGFAEDAAAEASLDALGQEEPN